MRPVTFALLAVLAGEPAGAAALDCPPPRRQVAAPLVVAFEHGKMAQPFVIGALWNGRDAVPEAGEDIDPPRPSHLAAELLALRNDENPGGVVRSLFEHLALEQERIQEQLEKVYEDSYLDSAKGAAGGVFEAIVDASIQQMEAYADLLDAATQSVEEFLAAHESGDSHAADEADAMLLITAAELIDLELVLRDPDCP